MGESKELEVSQDFNVLLQIYEDTIVNNQPAYFSKLLIETNLSKAELNKSLDKLYDRIMIETQFERLKDGKVVMGFIISKDFLPFAQGLYNATKIKEEQHSDIDKEF